MRKLDVGEVIRRQSLLTITFQHFDIPDPHALVHLQFRRYAGCPFCSLHLRSFIERHDELLAAGVHAAAVFYSSPTALSPYFAGVPLAVIADSEKKLYSEFGVESGLRAILDPRVWPAAVRGVLSKGLRFPRVWAGETPLGLPADFLISGEGRVLARRYGVHAYDQWSVDEVLDLARRCGNPSKSVERGDMAEGIPDQ